MAIFDVFVFWKRTNKELVGIDEYGNQYFRVISRNKEKRWIKYCGLAEASKIPARWHLWMHYTVNEVPSAEGKGNHIPNLTGTGLEYYPKRSLKRLDFKTHQTDCNYQEWQPNSTNLER